MTSIAVNKQVKSTARHHAFDPKLPLSGKELALEWLHFARRDLETAELLMDAEYHEALAGFELQQGMEKTFKAVLAYHGDEIGATHDLDELRKMIKPYLCIEDYLLVELLETATGYYRYVRYPKEAGAIPPMKQLLEVNELAHLLFEDVVRVLGIDMKEVYDDFIGC